MSGKSKIIFLILQKIHSFIVSYGTLVEFLHSPSRRPDEQEKMRELTPSVSYNLVVSTSSAGARRALPPPPPPWPWAKCSKGSPPKNMVNNETTTRKTKTKFCFVWLGRREPKNESKENRRRKRRRATQATKSRQEGFLSLAAFHAARWHGKSS